MVIFVGFMCKYSVFFGLIPPSCAFPAVRNALIYKRISSYSTAMRSADQPHFLLNYPETGNAGWNYLTVILLSDLVMLRYSFCIFQIFKAGHDLASQCSGGTKRDHVKCLHTSESTCMVLFLDPLWQEK